MKHYQQLLTIIINHWYDLRPLVSASEAENEGHGYDNDDQEPWLCSVMNACITILNNDYKYYIFTMINHGYKYISLRERYYSPLLTTLVTIINRY